MTRLIVASFNIRHGRGLWRGVDLRRTAAAMVATGADLIALQEVDRNMERSGGVDQPKVLGELTGMVVHFHPTLRRDGGEFGLAVAARGELETRFEPLDNLGLGRPHGVIVARWGGLTLLATHLSRIARARAAETAQLGTLAASVDGPVLVLGDLNQPSEDLAELRAAGLRGPEEICRGHPSLMPVRQIDHVLAGPGLEVERCRAIRTLASDHLPLVAELRRG